MPKTHLIETAKPAEELRSDYRIRALLIGPSKGGKTTSAVRTLPGKKLLIDTDGRAHSVAGLPDVDVIQVKRTEEKAEAWENLLTLKDDLWQLVEDKSFTYDAIIYDGLSSMRKITMDYCMTIHGSDGKLLQRIAGVVPTIAHVQPHMHETTKFIFNQLALPCHIVFTGHFSVYEDKNTNRIEYWPNVLSSSMRSEIGSWFDEVYHCWGEPTKDGMKYYWQTAPDRKLAFIGSTLNKQNKFWESPIEIDLDKSPAGFDYLMQKRFNK